MLLAIADENKNGKISWREFIPVGIDAIKTFLARNKLMAKGQIYDREVNPDTMKLVFEYDSNIEMVDIDKETKEHSGCVSFKFMRETFLQSSMLTIKEINLLLREYVMKYGYEQIKYTNFANDL